MWLVGISGIFNHIFFIFRYKIALLIVYEFDVLSLNEAVDHLWQTSDNDVSIKQFHHRAMDAFGNGLFVVKTCLDVVNHGVIDAVCP